MHSFSSFVESHGQPLLDISLYVSSENYIEVTRPLYNKIQPFPLPYLTPPSIRASAKARTAHLGLSSLDFDTEDTTHSSSESIIPRSLRRPHNTVSSLLASSPEANAQIRLDALATDFFEPLQKLRKGKRFFVSEEQLSSLDCLALGYLSLMLVPELPQPWLAKTMRRKFPDLCTWTNELRREVFGRDVGVEWKSPVESKRSHLPWKAPANSGVVGVGGLFLSSVADSIPIFGQLRRNTRMRQHGGKTPEEEQSSEWRTLTVLSSILAGVGLVAGYMFHQGMISFPSSEEPNKRSGGGLGAFGEAGDMLSLYANQMDRQVYRQRQLEREMSGSQAVPVVAVEIGQDGVRSNDSIA
jgi:sorting and assembly machinery component 37